MTTPLFPSPGAVLCAAFLAFSLPAMGQTISNPGFEKDLTDWLAIRDSDMSRASAEAAHSGALGLRVKDENPKYNSSLTSLATEATPGQKYEITFWARTLAGEGNVAVSLRFCDEKERPLQKKGPYALVTKTPEWKQYTITGVAPPNSVMLVLWIHSTQVESVTADFDDFTCKVLP